MIDLRDTRWSKTQVAKIMDMVVSKDGEFIVCESLDGERYELNLVDTNLQGFVPSYISDSEVMRSKLAGKRLPLLVELGLSDSSHHSGLPIPFIELLITSDEFDSENEVSLKRCIDEDTGETDAREVRMYQARKQRSVVPHSIHQGVVLYYTNNVFI